MKKLRSYGITGSLGSSAGINARLRAGAVWNFIGSGAARGSLLISSFFLANILGQRSFGQFALIQQTILMFQAVAAAAIGNAAARHIALVRERDPEAAARVATLCIVTGIVMSVFPLAFLVPVFSKLVPSAITSLRPVFLPGFIAVAGIVIFNVQVGIQAGFEAFHAVGRSTALMGIASSVFGVIGASLAGLSGAIYGVAVGNWCGVIWAHGELVTIGRREGIWLLARGFWSECRMLWTFSVPSLLSNLIVTMAVWAAIALLGSRRGGFNEVGIFSAANQLFLAIVFFPTVVGRAILPILSKQGANREELSYVIRRSIQVTLIVVVTIASVCVIWGNTIMSAFGDAFAFHTDVLLICVASATILAVQIPLGQVIIAKGFLWAGFLMNLGWAATFFLLLWMLLPYGAIGLAFAQAGAYVVHAVWTVTFAARLLRRTLPGKTVGSIDPAEVNGFAD